MLPLPVPTSLALWRDWMTVTARLTAPSGALLELGVLPEKPSRQVCLKQGGNPGPPSYLLLARLQPQPPERFLGTQFENHGTHSTGVRWWWQHLPPGG